MRWTRKNHKDGFPQMKQWLRWLVVSILCWSSSTVSSQSASTLAERIQSVMSRSEFRHSTFGIEIYSLDSGKVLPELTLVYETYGRLEPDGRNAILITHGFTSSQHATGKYAPTDRAPGWWDGLIGPGQCAVAESSDGRLLQGARS